MKKKIAVFTGAGISAESGVATFRDTGDGLWYNYKIDEVATVEAWRKDRGKVLEFHNMLRSKLKGIEPNDAHKALVKLEDIFDVTIITQNVDSLHEKAGSTNVLHLHGELTKARSCLYNHKPSPLDELIDIGYNDLNLGDKDPKTGSQLRPHTVLFGEFPYNTQEAYDAIGDADYLLIIGTSLQITYTLQLLNTSGSKTKVYYIDPNPSKALDVYGMNIKYIEKSAVEGVTEVVNELLKK